VCPVSYDLGEDLRMVLLSTTEGEDKPLKYRILAVCANIERVRPGIRISKSQQRPARGQSLIDSLFVAATAS